MLRKIFINALMLVTVFCMTTALVFARDAIAGPPDQLPAPEVASPTK